MARPSTYTEDLATRICDRLADGQSLREVCRADDMPARETVRLWLNANETFRARYDRAILDRTDAWLEEIIEIANGSSDDWIERKRPDGSTERVLNTEAVARSKLRIHARQWAMSRMQPRKYGDKLAIGGDAEAPPVKVEMSATDLARRLFFLMEKGAREAERERGAIREA